MDGNGRWAKKRFRPRWMGHRSGGAAVRTVVESAAKAGIDVLTLFAFGTDNWRRPEKEVNFLMDLFHQHLAKESAQLHANQIRVRFVGDVSQFDSTLQERIAQTQNLTATNTGMTLVIAANYSGQWDITQATKAMCEKAKAGMLAPDDITQDTISAHLSIGDLPYPDLLIRTSGEQRISNFYLWQLAYAELYFTDVLWPDFSDKELTKALNWYATRERRFGHTGDQLKEATDA
jgi:undecaprenyl diphosphate synthase